MLKKYDFDLTKLETLRVGIIIFSYDKNRTKLKNGRTKFGQLILLNRVNVLNII